MAKDMREEEIEEGSEEEVEEYLHAVQYPVERDDLLEEAEEWGVSENTIRRLAGIPRKRYGSADEVNEELAST